jgi:phospholipase C
MRPAFFAVLALSALGCQSSSSPAPLPPADDTCSGPCPQSNVKHVVIVIQENQTFDTHFGGYCTAPAGSSPTCNTGPACCEAAPAHDPSGASPVILDDALLGSYDPNHTQACESSEIDDGGMDHFTTGLANCASPDNFALAEPSIIRPFWDLAAQSALADRYFQPVVGESYSNDMYFAQAKYDFLDDEDAPAGAVGVTCSLEGVPVQLTGPTIGDLLTSATVPWTFFAAGYDAMVAANDAGTCPPAPAACPFGLAIDPCVFEPSDDPFDFFASTRDNPAVLKDLSALDDALKNGGLPAVSFVKAIEYETEHPGFNCKLSAGVGFVTSLIDEVESSRYRDDTLVLVTYDEGGGYFDHVPPPAASAVDQQAYGTRVPLMAVGPFAKKNYISHVVMEHSSIVKFLEWNWLKSTGQLGARDAVVANRGDLLDSSSTGTAVPSN